MPWQKQRRKARGILDSRTTLIIYSGKDKSERASSGVGLLVRQDLVEKIKAIEYISDRFLITTFQLKKCTTTHIVSIYAPDITKTQQERNKLFQDLQHILDTMPRQDEAILMGDLNTLSATRIS